MAGEDDERLIVLLEARIKDLEKNMAKASGITAKTYREMSLGSKRATDQMEEHMVRSTTRINQALATTSTKIGAFGKAMIDGFVGGLAAGGIAGVISQVASVARGVAEVGDEARRAGLDIEAFQELKYVAEQNRIGVDALTDGMKELNLRADEFIATGGGSAAEAFGRLGYSADQLKVKLKDPSALFTEIIGKLEHLDRAAQIRIADELFGGTGGEKFVQLIEQGADGIKATIREAHDLGAVMSKEVIARADELDRKFNAITTSVGTGLKTAIVEAAAALQQFINTYQGFASRYQQALNASEAGAAIGGMVGAKDKRSVRTTPKTSRLAELPPELPSQEELSAKFLADYRNELSLTNRERAVAAEAERILSEASSKGLSVTKEQAQALAVEKVARDEGEKSSKKLGGERERAAKKTAAESEKIRTLISDLEEELRLVNASDAAKRASAASREAGAYATEQERQRVIALTEAIHKEEEAKALAQDRTLLYRDLTRSALDDVFSGIEENKSAFEIMGDVAVNSLKRIADTLIDDVLDSIFKVNNAANGSGGGLLGGLLSGILGGGAKADPWAGMRMPSFDGGGHTGMGARTGGLDGKGGFLAMMHPRETVTDHTRPGSSSGSSQLVTVKSDVRVSVDHNGNLKAFVERTSQEISARTSGDMITQFSREALPSRVNEISQDPRARG